MQYDEQQGGARKIMTNPKGSDGGNGPIGRNVDLPLASGAGMMSKSSFSQYRFLVLRETVKQRKACCN